VELFLLRIQGVWGEERACTADRLAGWQSGLPTVSSISCCVFVCCKINSLSDLRRRRKKWKGVERVGPQLGTDTHRHRGREGPTEREGGCGPKREFRGSFGREENGGRGRERTEGGKSRHGQEGSLLSSSCQFFPIVGSSPHLFSSLLR